MTEVHLFTRSEALLSGRRPERDPRLAQVRRGVWSERRLGSAEPFEADRQRYLALVRAAHLTLTGDHLFSHESAAVVLGLPLLARWPATVHLLDERRRGGRSQRDIVRHCLGLDGVRSIVIDGMLVTSPARVALDLALTRPFDDALVVADAVLRLYPDAEEELRSLADAYGHGRGWMRLQRVIEAMDGRSGSVGETISRIRIAEHGFVTPELQVPIVTDGRTEWGDFGWECVLGLGEFDGRAKYLLDRYRKGGTIEQIVLREKDRENRIRRQRPRFARWDWSDLTENRLERILLAAGIPKHRR